jgi:hypothetical protein
MKKIVAALVGLFFLVNANSQVKDPVSWTFSSIKRAPGIYEIVIAADVPSPWHMYSMNTPKGGPVPTAVVFKMNPLITKQGKLKEKGNLETVNDKVFGVKVLYFGGKVEYSQIVKVKGGISTNISGTVAFMVCDEKQCLPPTKKTFDIKLQ